MVRDLSNLPRATGTQRHTQSGYMADTTTNPLAAELEDIVLEVGRAGDDKPHAIEGTRWRASMAGTCMRQNAYYISGTPKSEPMGAEDYYRMQLGTDMHARIETILAARMPHLEFEGKVDLRELGIDGSGHFDMWDPQTKTLYEIKTINGFGFKKLAAWANATGPRFSHVMQAGLYGTVLGAEQVCIVYLNQEVISPNEQDKNSLEPIESWVTTFTIPIDDIDVAGEITRLKFVFDTLDDEELGLDAVPRYEPEMPPAARVTQPKPVKGNAPWVKLNAEGQPEKAGNTWRCGYCAWQTRCQKDLDGNEAF